MKPVAVLYSTVCHQTYPLIGLAQPIRSCSHICTVWIACEARKREFVNSCL